MVEPSTESETPLIARLHPSLRATFIPLPPAGTPLNAEQLDALFPPEHRTAVLRDMVRLVMANSASKAAS